MIPQARFNSSPSVSPSSADGRPVAETPPPSPTAAGSSSMQRFLAKVSEPDARGCTLWRGCLSSNGYGRFWHDAADHRAHRVSWMLFVGPIHDGLCVLHHCDVRSCVNPEHLFIGTQQDNMDDKIRKGRDGPCRAGLLSADRRGERNSQARLTEAQAKEILLRADAGETARSLAMEFGVARLTVRRLVSGVTWAHLERPASKKATTLRVAHSSETQVSVSSSDISNP